MKEKRTGFWGVVRRVASVGVLVLGSGCGPAEPDYADVLQDVCKSQGDEGEASTVVTKWDGEKVRLGDEGVTVLRPGIVNTGDSSLEIDEGSGFRVIANYWGNKFSYGVVARINADGKRTDVKVVYNCEDKTNPPKASFGDTGFYPGKESKPTPQSYAGFGIRRK